MPGNVILQSRDITRAGQPRAQFLALQNPPDRRAKFRQLLLRRLQLPHLPWL